VFVVVIFDQNPSGMGDGLANNLQGPIVVVVMMKFGDGCGKLSAISPSIGALGRGCEEECVQVCADLFFVIFKMGKK
jgi:hypothetical protein